MPLMIGLLFVIFVILVQLSGEGIVGKMPYINLMVKYCFNCFAGYVSRDAPCFCVLSVEKTVPSEKEKRSFSLLDVVTTVPESEINMDL